MFSNLDVGLSAPSLLLCYPSSCECCMFNSFVFLWACVDCLWRALQFFYFLILFYLSLIVVNLTCLVRLPNSDAATARLSEKNTIIRKLNWNRSWIISCFEPNLVPNHWMSGTSEDSQLLLSLLVSSRDRNVNAKISWGLFYMVLMLCIHVYLPVVFSFSFDFSLWISFHHKLTVITATGEILFRCRKDLMNHMSNIHFLYWSTILTANFLRNEKKKKMNLTFENCTWLWFNF